MIKHVRLAKNKCLEDLLLPPSCFSSLLSLLCAHLFPPPPSSRLSPAISVLSSLHRSAQQRSSQTNKSQSSAGNQVSICRVLSVTHKQRSVRSREDRAPTRWQDGENTNREMLNPLHHTDLMIYTFYLYVFIMIIIISYFSHACCIMFSRAPVVYSLHLWFYDFISKRITLGSITLCHHHHWCCC